MGLGTVSSCLTTTHISNSLKVTRRKKNRSLMPRTQSISRTSETKTRSTDTATIRCDSQEYASCQPWTYRNLFRLASEYESAGPCAQWHYYRYVTRSPAEFTAGFALGIEFFIYVIRVCVCVAFCWLLGYSLFASGLKWNCCGHADLTPDVMLSYIP
ncbi:hypothetical protein GGR53DRAFT_416514 [Hypoxylon sp. FL1150]|nr:hypothetical protein GGR53DRAFT_416514 [Hypoxylon sp. FL1150]